MAEPIHDGGPAEPEDRWTRLAALFDSLLGGAEIAGILAAEPDPELRRAAELLWKHHIQASDEAFMEHPLEFEVLPMFQPGQVLANRFLIQRDLGAGGMGEVYLAYDQKLSERVALKTIARLLVSSASTRRRFLAEVQNARRVTHPNVCRIYDLFEQGQIAFFAMEYIEGQTLHQVLHGSSIQPIEALAIVRQLAEGLHAAHQSGVVHGDFKPSNVMIVPGETTRAVIMDFGLARALEEAAAGARREHSTEAGTVDYMAPELLAGSPPSIRSDIFAFGKVARLLLPGKGIWDDCTRTNPDERTPTLEGVIHSLGPLTTRRYWLMGALAGAGAITYSVFMDKPARLLLAEGSRLLVNGFHAVAGQVPAARLARAMLLNALQQSPRIHTIADQDLFTSLRRLVSGGNLPVEGEILRRLLSELRAGYWIDAQLGQGGGRYSLSLSLLRASDQQLAAQTAFRDVPAIPALAEQTAIWMRRLAGESEQSLVANPATVTTFTSTVPEALQNYYDAMEYYSVGEMDQAIPLLEGAIRLDPQFAQAHNVLGMCLNSLRKHAEAFHNLELAEKLSARLPERERAWIETNYSMLVEDPQRMIRSARRNVSYHPDEPRYYRVLAQVLCRNGYAADSIPYSRKAVQLAPQDDLLRNDLVVNLCESGRFAEGLYEYQRAIAQGSRNPYLNRGAGLAYLGLENYEDALRSFQAVPGSNGRLIQGTKILAGGLESAVAGLQQDLSQARAQENAAEEHQCHEFLCATYFLTDRPGLARSHLLPMAQTPPYPPFAKELQCAVFWAARLRDEETLQNTGARLLEITTRWPNSHTRATAAYADALVSRNRGDIPKAEVLLLESLGSAFTIWPLFELADLYTATNKLDLAEEYWGKKFESRSGTILKLWFTGTLVYAWLNRAITARLRQDHVLARRCANKVLDHWSHQNPNIRIVQIAGNIYSTSHLKGDDHG